MRKNISAKIIFALRALRNRNYRLFSAGQIISLIGSWVQFIAITWLAYRLTNSEILMGVIAFAGQIPSFFLTPFTGVLVDRYNKHKIIIATQTFSMLQAGILAVLTLTNTITPILLVLLNLILGIINAIDMPARQAFITELLDNPDDLTNAIAINSLTFNTARIIGPAIAGFIIVIVGEGICFAINTVSFLGIIISLISMHLPNEKHAADIIRHNVLKEMKDGILYIIQVKIIFFTLALLAITNFLGTAYFVIMPIYVTKILNNGPHTFDLLMTFMGCGAVLGAVLLTLKKSTAHLAKIITMTALFFGISLILLANTVNVFYAYLILFSIGFFLVSQLIASNTTLQATVDNDKRGRVMSFYALALVGISPFGNLTAGFIANSYGIVTTIAIAGIINTIAGVIYFYNIRRIKET